MTPLAQRLMRQELEGRRGWFPQELASSELPHMRCFDCVAVSEMSEDLAADMRDRDVITRQVAFLPAPLTWIEYKPWPTENRSIAYLLRANDDASSASVYLAHVLLESDAGNASPRLQAVAQPAILASMVNKVNLVPMGTLYLGQDACAMGMRLPRPDIMPEEFPDPNDGIIFKIYALLAIINTPRLIGQCQRTPHVGLQRQLRQSKDFASAELPEWTQVNLHVLDGRERREAGDISGVLSGQRALHFCRSFIRIRLGKLELVRAHMRGNAELGERRPIYVVQ